MTLEDWNGIDNFMAGGEVSNREPDYMEAHEEAVETVEDQLQAYMLVYGEDSYDLVDPSTKYSAEGLLDN